MKKTVAICIPSYNNIGPLTKLLNSIEIQLYKDFFVVISDDSTYNCVEKLIEKYFNKFEIIYSKNNIPLGPTLNTNNAIKLANQHDYKYLKIMHHDDFFTYDYSLEKFVEMLESNPDALIAFSGTVQVTSVSTYTRCIEDQQVCLLEQDCRNLVFGNSIGAPSATIVRNTDILLDEDLKWNVDWEWYMRILEKNNTFAYTKAPLVSICMGETNVTNSCTTNQELMINELLIIQKKHENLRRSPFFDYFCESVFSYTQKVLCLKEIENHFSNSLYIYGAGCKGQSAAQFFNSNGIKFKGFLVSNSKPATKTLFGHNVYSIYDVIKKEPKMHILLALNENNAMEVMDLLTSLNFPEEQIFQIKW